MSSRCELCGSMKFVELHHIIPIVFGGPDIPENWIMICVNCHTRLTPRKLLQEKGIAIAKAKGRYHGRKPIDIDEDAFKKECTKWRAGEQTATETMSKLGLKPNTFYRKVKQLDI